MNKREEWREYVAAAAKEYASSPTDHLSEEEMIHYRQGHFEDQERVRVEVHLARCAECLETLSAASEFLQSLSPGEAMRGAQAPDPDFEALWQRLDSPAPARPGFLGHPRALFALAASLFVALALTLIWALSLRQENQRLAERPSEPGVFAGQLSTLEQKNRELQEQLVTLQQESRRLQEHVNASKQQYESELAQLKQPEVNAPVRNIYPRDDQQRSGEPGEANRISVPHGTRTFTVILADYERGYQDYRVEIVDRAGRLIWQGQGLRPSEAGDLTLMLNRTFLGQKRFTLKLYGQRDGRSRKVAEYIVIVE